MQAARQTISTDELKSRLLAQIDSLVHHFAPEAKGSYHKGNLYFTLNPGRADRSVGSFCVTMDGDKAGQWRDYATGEHGDIIDLIGLSLGLNSPHEKFKVARQWLGLDTEDPATSRARALQAEKLKAARQARAKDDADKVARMRQTAKAVFLSGREDILRTPVAKYLAGRGIDLATFARLPHAIRYHAECRYYYEADWTDPQTGEVSTRTQWRALPAMVTAIARGRDIIDCHRTYLACADDGTWTKADVPNAKKVFTDYTGGCVRLSGERGPRDGHLRLSQAPQGARVYVTEGIENALSLIALRALLAKPPAFVVAAGSLWNMAHLELPEAVTAVTLAADNDHHPEARAGLDKAVAFHAAKGREVRVWRSRVPGRDFNDELRARLALMRSLEAAE